VDASVYEAQTGRIMMRIYAQYLLAGRACDADFIIRRAAKQAMAPDIPTKRSHKGKRAFNQCHYRHRRLIQSVFVHLEHWRGVATSFAWNTSFLAAIQVQCVATWANVL
jgi:hypothetical protein